MAPVPHSTKKKLQEVKQKIIYTSDVIDNSGRALSQLLRRQNLTDRKQNNNITVAREHSSLGESDNTLVFRDIFPGRKYQLTLSDTTWMGSGNVVTIGYTVGDTFTQISSTATAPEDNEFDIEMPSVAAIDTLEVRLVGATGSIRGYLEDKTDSSSISAAIANLLDAVADLIRGQEDLSDAIEQLQDDVEDLDERVTAIEQELHPTPEPEPNPNEPEPDEPLEPSEP